jgi:hypothetical protein
VAQSKTMLGWHFAETSRRLRYGDDRPIVVGESHSVKGEPILCKHGLHASESVLDALQYAPWADPLPGEAFRNNRARR